MSKPNRPTELACPSGDWLPTWLAIAVLAAAVWTVFGRSLDAPLIFDDEFSVVANESIVRLWPMWGDGGQPGPLSRLHDSPVAGRPLVNLSLAINYQIGGLDPRGYHVVNILLHTLNVLLLWALLRRTLRLPYFGQRFDESSGALGFGVALVWAVHPLVTEAVIYTTQRTELLVSFFYLATLYGSLRYWEAERPKWLMVAVFACWAGMASKENMVSAPVMVLLYDRTFVAGSFKAAWQKSRALYLGLASSWILLVLLNMSGPRAASAGFDAGVPVHVWWFTQAKVLLTYLKLAVWPWPLSIHHDIPYLETFRATWPYAVITSSLVIAGLVLLWRRTAAGLLVATLFAFLAPTLVVPVPTEVAAERRMYLPLAALATLAVVGSYSMCQRLAVRLNLPVRSSLVGIVALCLAVSIVAGSASVRRLAAYSDPIVLWSDALAYQPNNIVAHNNLGHVLVVVGRSDDALAHFDRAVELEPAFFDAHFNRANALVESNRLEAAAAAYQRVVELNPEYAQAWANLAAVYGRLGRTDSALAAAKKGLRAARSSGQNATAVRIEAWLKDYLAWLSKVGTSDPPRQEPAPR